MSSRVFVSLCKRRENSSSDCPTCKHPLTDSQLFPDNFANREVQSLTVKCPNTKLGCTTVVELRNVEVRFSVYTGWSKNGYPV